MGWGTRSLAARRGRRTTRGSTGRDRLCGLFAYTFGYATILIYRHLKCFKCGGYERHIWGYQQGGRGQRHRALGRARLQRHIFYQGTMFTWVFQCGRVFANARGQVWMTSQHCKRACIWGSPWGTIFCVGKWVFGTFGVCGVQRGGRRGTGYFHREITWGCSRTTNNGAFFGG